MTLGEGFEVPKPHLIPVSSLSVSLSVSAIAPAPCLPFAIHHTTMIMDQSSETEYNVHGIFMCDSKELRLTHMSPRARAAHCTFSEMLLSHEKG